MSTYIGQSRYDRIVRMISRSARTRSEIASELNLTPGTVTDFLSAIRKNSVESNFHLAEIYSTDGRLFRILDGRPSSSIRVRNHKYVLSNFRNTSNTPIYTRASRG